MPSTADFITRWKRSSASERANYALFLSELCDLIGVPRPDPSTSDEDANTYVIDKAVVFKELDARPPQTSSISTNAAASFWKLSRAAILPPAVGHSLRHES